jgi:hypothetical protein
MMMVRVKIIDSREVVELLPNYAISIKGNLPARQP